MRSIANRAAAVTLCGLALFVSAASAQREKNKSLPAVYEERGEDESASPAPAVLSSDDGLSVIAAALDAKVQASRPRDCSHLVQVIYSKAGFPYPYASSSDLYDGTDDFERVSTPQPGDLVVWPGHVGIVISPSRRVFYSRLRRGPGIDNYDTQYWKKRGSARFYRYVTGVPTRTAAAPLPVSHRRK